MKLTRLLRLQVIYFILGMVYNGLSLYLTSTGSRHWHPPNLFSERYP